MIDSSVSCECPAAGLESYQKHRDSRRKVTGMIYSQSHGDHYIGATGVIDADTNVPIFAPEGFIETILS